MRWEWCLYYTSNPITKYVIKRERFVVKRMSTPLADGPFLSSIIQYKTETFPLPSQFTNEFGLHCHEPLAKRFTSRHRPQYRDPKATFFIIPYHIPLNSLCIPSGLLTWTTDFTFIKVLEMDEKYVRQIYSSLRALLWSDYSSW